MEVVCCYCQEAGEFDEDAAVLLDADDFAFDTFEGAIDDFDGLTFTELLRDLGEVDDVLVEGRGDLDEVVHRLFRDGEGAVGGAVPVVVDRADVAEGADVCIKCFPRPIDEAEAAYSRNELLFFLAAYRTLAPCHRDEGSHSPFGEFVADLQFAGVGGAEREPLRSGLTRL